MQSERTVSLKTSDDGIFILWCHILLLRSQLEVRNDTSLGLLAAKQKKNQHKNSNNKRSEMPKENIGSQDDTFPIGGADCSVGLKLCVKMIHISNGQNAHLKSHIGFISVANG